MSSDPQPLSERLPVRATVAGTPVHSAARHRGLAARCVGFDCDTNPVPCAGRRRTVRLRCAAARNASDSRSCGGADMPGSTPRAGRRGSRSPAADQRRCDRSAGRSNPARHHQRIHRARPSPRRWNGPRHRGTGRDGGGALRRPATCGAGPACTGDPVRARLRRAVLDLHRRHHRRAGERNARRGDCQPSDSVGRRRLPGRLLRRFLRDAHLRAATGGRARRRPRHMAGSLCPVRRGRDRRPRVAASCRTSESPVRAGQPPRRPQREPGHRCRFPGRVPPAHPSPEPRAPWCAAAPP